MCVCVIYFAPNGAVGQRNFTTVAEATAFDQLMLNKGYTTSGVLGEQD